MKQKHLFVAILCLVSAVVNAVPYFVRVNGVTNYATTPAGTQDFQGRDQYYANCIALEVNDLITCYDAGGNDGQGAEWTIQALDQYGAFESFTMTNSGLKCNVAGTYNIYLKFKFEDDQIYIEEGKECTSPAEPVDPSKPTYSNSAPAQYPGVMLQGFYWDSNADHGYGRTKWIDLYQQAGELGKWFDLIWLPPSAKSTGGTGYIPLQYSNQSSDWGSKGNLVALINTLHQNGARVVADIVVNHIGNQSGWCTFYEMDFGEFGTYNPTAEWICKTDEMNSSSDAGSCKGTATGANDDGYGSEANYDSARDWDHTNPAVRDMIKSYLKWLRKEIGYDGWRYDYCKGFHNSHINEYNLASEAFFSVMEMWDGNPDVLQSHINDAGWNTTTFDFGTKYDAFNGAIASSNFSKCKGAGLVGRGKGRYAVTFIDSHDSFQRDDNEFCGKGNGMKYPDKVLQANAYLLSMPGTPCVFWPHWVTYKEELQAMINARHKTGVHNESAVSDEAGSGFYRATITGTNGSIKLFLGAESGYNNQPAGYTLAVKGTNWAVYYQTTSPRGDKPDNRTPIGEAVEQVKENTTSIKSLENGQLLIHLGDATYDCIGRKIK